MEELSLRPNQECNLPIYINKRLLSKTPERGGITIDNQEDIILVKPETLLEREIQTNENNLRTKSKRNY